jgi:hypothetical protein
MQMHIKGNKSLFFLKKNVYLCRIILLHNTNIASLFLLNRKVKLQKMMQLRTKENMSCFPQRKKQDSWNLKLNNVMNI